jgi:aspartate racemase
MNSTDDRIVTGVVGGLGPRASNSFVGTIYELCADRIEQEQPRILLWSDPSVPDRTWSLAAGEEGVLVRALEGGLARLRDAGAEQIVICCITAHAVLEQIDESLRSLVIGLPDLAIEALRASGTPHLLACTTGTFSSGVFAHRLEGDDMESLLIEPPPAEQQHIHDLIYRLKYRSGDDEVARELASLAVRHRTGIVAGCTELHLVSRHSALRTVSVIDPLEIAAQRIVGLVTPSQIPAVVL